MIRINQTLYPTLTLYILAVASLTLLWISPLAPMPVEAPAADFPCFLAALI
jgi:hypothetical protein